MQNKLNPVNPIGYVPTMSIRSISPSVRGILLCLFLSGAILSGKDDGEKKGLMDRVMNPDRNAPSAFQGKEFHPEGEFRGKTYKTGEYATGVAGEKQSFLTKPFAGIRDALFGKKDAVLKDLPDRYREDSRYSGKSYGSKDYATKDFSQSSKTAKEAGATFETRQASVKGVTQGAFDNNPDLREAVKKGLSIDDIRKLLNKAP